MKRILVALCLFVVSCGPPTVEGAESRYKSNVDKISAIVTRKPEAKATLDAKLAEFKAEHETAMKETDDQKKISALSSLSSRMETFINDVEPPAKSGPGGVTAPSDKLDKKGVTPAGTPTTPTAPGGKLDGPGGSGMGGPAGTPTPTPVGSATPTPTPTPATPTTPTTPAAPSSGGGMGGM